MPDDENDHAWLTPLWDRAQANWTDAAVHKAILAQCQTADRLAEVARRYRQQAEDPERAGVARQQLDAIVGLAFAQLAPRSAPPEKSRIWQWLWLFLLLAGVVALAREL
jgi:hypothetical protein